MVAKKWLLLVGITFLSMAIYAQKGFDKAVETTVNRQVFNRAKLPTVRDGMRNLVTRRLGKIPTTGGGGTRSVLNFGAPLQAKQIRVEEFPRIVGGRHDERGDGFYSVAKPGSGNIEAIALPAHALIKQAAIAESATMENRKVLLQMAETLDRGFAMSQEGNWQLTHGYTFNQFHKLLKHFKDQWMTYSKAYGGSGDPLSQGVNVALDVLEIQAWMLTHGGRLPQNQTDEIELFVAWKLDKLMEKAASDVAFAQDPAVQGAMQHLVHLRAAAKGEKSPFEVIKAVLDRIDNGGRIPGSSLVNVDATEDKLIRELNYVEQLRRANLLHVLIPMEQSQSLLDLYLRDFQSKGHIYQQMIQIIPEFANDGVTLNVPTHSAQSWEVALNEWEQARAAAGLSQTPRAMITGRMGLPLNFNDLTADEKTEVLLGTYLRIQKK